jgi:hypothetical protein
MRPIGSLAVCCSLVLGLAAPAAAQPVQVPPPDALVLEPLSPEQDGELQAWLSEMAKWQRYDAKYRNRPARDSFGRIAERKSRPAAPEWLPVRCESASALGVLALEERTAEACRLLIDPLSQIGVGPSAAATAEKPDKYSSFLRRIHLDGLWVSTSSGPRAYGLVGSHLTLVDVGRVQIFGPPGVLLLSLPDRGGERRLTLGYTWGLSVKLGDIKMMSQSKNMTLFLTVSKVWVGGSSPEQTAGRDFQIAGLSLAPRKKQ